ncbi:MAG: hypothetical protein ISS46_02280 [Candidatus Omnitrophica bacterium]|nr:hypothetical protein [Candidatus Omnitrophota bacterium]
MEYDSCRENLDKLIEWCGKNSGTRNEATTRLTMIDRLFFECLDWEKSSDVILEESHDRKYADYTFSAPRKMLIVEAKKEGTYFEVPVGKERVEYSLRSLIRDNTDLIKATEQVAGYCQHRGVPYGAVSNGHQLIVFIATRNDGIAPLEGRALVFQSLESIAEHFLDFWQVLSKKGIENKKLHSVLIGEKQPELPPKLSSSITDYPGVKGRNIFQTDLQVVSELVIEDIVRAHDLEKTFLEECYCRSGALSQYALISKTILESRYAALFENNKPRPTTVSATDKEGISAELLAESLSRRPILLIGDVGVGKTAFIRNLMKVEAESLFEDAIPLYLDLGAQATLTCDLKVYILKEIEKQLIEHQGIDIYENNFVRGIYNRDLERFRKGIYKDLLVSEKKAFQEKELNFLESKIENKEEHLQATLQHISKGRRKQVVLFLDNAD